MVRANSNSTLPQFWNKLEWNEMEEITYIPLGTINTQSLGWYSYRKKMLLRRRRFFPVEKPSQTSEIKWKRLFLPIYFIPFDAIQFHVF